MTNYTKTKINRFFMQSEDGTQTEVNFDDIKRILGLTERPNIIMDVDSYKVSHFKQYPPGTTHISSYIESRGGRWDKTLFFGLQSFLKKYLCHAITQENINEAEAFFLEHCGSFNRAGWQHILDKHDGYLPIKITALPEGTVISGRNVLVQIINTDPEAFWLVSYVETMLLRAVWYPVTVGTNSWQIKQRIYKALQVSCDNPDAVIGFMLNDFGSRGVSSLESSQLGGMAHLANFLGTDNVPAVRAAQTAYNCKMAGFSIPATEHSTTTAWGEGKELACIENMINQFGKGLFANVGDSYDIYNFVQQIVGTDLKERIKTMGGRMVVRPDSGDPIKVAVEVVEMLLEAFAEDVTINGKGFKVLPNYIRVIQGDGVNIDSIGAICDALIARGISVENICFGMGGALLQQLDRDTLKFAMKASAALVNGVWRDVFKDPITDKGKVSKKGVLALVKYEVTGEYITIRESELNGRKNYLEPVFENGILRREQTFDEIRALSNDNGQTKVRALAA